MFNRFKENLVSSLICIFILSFIFACGGGGSEGGNNNATNNVVFSTTNVSITSIPGAIMRGKDVTATLSQSAINQIGSNDTLFIIIGKDSNIVSDVEVLISGNRATLSIFTNSGIAVGDYTTSINVKACLNSTNCSNTIAEANLSLVLHQQDFPIGELEEMTLTGRYSDDIQIPFEIDFGTTGGSIPLGKAKFEVEYYSNRNEREFTSVTENQRWIDYDIENKMLTIDSALGCGTHKTRTSFLISAGDYYKTLNLVLNLEIQTDSPAILSIWPKVAYIGGERDFVATGCRLDEVLQSRVELGGQPVSEFTSLSSNLARIKIAEIENVGLLDLLIAEQIQETSQNSLIVEDSFRLNEGTYPIEISGFFEGNSFQKANYDYKNNILYMGSAGEPNILRLDNEDIFNLVSFEGLREQISGSGFGWGIAPNGELVVITSYGYYWVDPVTLTIKRQFEFDRERFQIPGNLAIDIFGRILHKGDNLGELELRSSNGHLIKKFQVTGGHALFDEAGDKLSLYSTTTGEIHYGVKISSTDLSIEESPSKHYADSGYNRLRPDFKGKYYIYETVDNNWMLVNNQNSEVLDLSEYIVPETGNSLTATNGRIFESIGALYMVHPTRTDNKLIIYNINPSSLEFESSESSMKVLPILYTRDSEKYIGITDEQVIISIETKL